MNEQRQQAYLQLIQNLLNCRSDDEIVEILTVNQDLIDAGFWEMVEAVAQMFSQKGEENTANWLRNLAQWLSSEVETGLSSEVETGLSSEVETGLSSGVETETTPITEADIQTYLQFILEVLQATADSGGNPEVIYPLLAANTDKLNNIFAELLRRWATNTLGGAEADTAKYIAALMVILGNLIQQFPLGSKADNMEIAITGYEIALTVYTRSAFPQDWAMTQNNLGTAYSQRILGEKAENLENAIAALTAALEVRTRTAFPEQWAMTQNNLGAAYLYRILGEKAENLENAIAAYSAALEVRTRTAFPQENATTLLNLGMLYQDETQQFDLAYNTFAEAIKTVESLRGETNSGEEAKRKQAEEWNRLYRRMVEVCLALSRNTEAIEYVERSKTRNLVEQILERDSKTIFPPEVVTQLETYRDEIAAGQYQIQNGKAENPQELAQHLQQLRQQRNELQNQYLPVGYGFKFDSFQPTLDERTAILELYILNNKILAFIATQKGEVKVWQSKPKDRAALQNWGNQYLRNYDEQKDQWQNKLGENLKKLAAILHIDEILNQIPKCCDKLILIPHLFLHLFPLHALPVTSQNHQDSRCLLDVFTGGVSYAPSCQLLQQVQQRKRPDFQSLFAIQNPTEDLNYTDLEVQVIQSYFNNSNVLKKSAATLTAINNSDLNTYHCTHFSCHGYFDLTNPSKSALILANAPVADLPTKPNSERYLDVRLGETHDLDKCLTLDKIFALKLEKCRLVTLSACETGLIDFNNNSDEYIGLPSGFLLAGSPSIVSSLWTVDDLSTSFLMIKFYDNLFKLDNLKAGDIAIALKEAQNWLRNLTIEELDRFLEEHQPQIEKVLAQLRVGQRKIFQESLNLIKQREPLPFANPYYWAGFTASGL